MANKYNSGTSVQHIFKLDTVTLTAKASIGSVGAPSLVVAEGVSKTAAVERQDTGKYAIYWDVPAQVTLGAPQVAILNPASGSGDLYSVQLLSTFESYNSAPCAGVSLQVFRLSGSTEATPADPPNGAALLATVIASTSPVF